MKPSKCSWLMNCINSTLQVYCEVENTNVDAFQNSHRRTFDKTQWVFAPGIGMNTAVIYLQVIFKEIAL